MVAKKREKHNAGEIQGDEAEETSGKLSKQKEKVKEDATSRPRPGIESIRTRTKYQNNNQTSYPNTRPHEDKQEWLRTHSGRHHRERIARKSWGHTQQIRSWENNNESNARAQ